jgi:hypothetical protein
MAAGKERKFFGGLFSLAPLLLVTAALSKVAIHKDWRQ